MRTVSKQNSRSGLTKVLCVDDDCSLLEGYQRALRKRFVIHTALSGQAGLESITKQGPYAVIVSDFRMPRMDGIQFLAQVGETAPDSIRVMLTGHGERKTAIAAVNHGHVFQFLLKPCPVEAFAEALSRADKQYHRNLLRRIHHPFIDSFRRKQFKALVGFVDICRFSELACGKSAVDVRDLVMPFIQSAIQAACDHRCYVDKTIGDEVMVIMPFLRETAGHGSAPFFEHAPFNLEEMRIPDLSGFLTDLKLRLTETSPDLTFSGGFAFGSVLFDEIQAGGYNEWTVYGNCVSAAKRLQEMANSYHTGDRTQAQFALGAIEAEHPEFKQNLSCAVVNCFVTTGMRPVGPVGTTRNLKGVGNVSYITVAL